MWTTKDGSKIAYKDLSDDHLVNILKMLLKNAEAKKEALLENSWIAMGFFQGEMALYDIERTIHSLDQMTDEEFLETYSSHWEHLVAEAKRRKLNWR